MKIQYGGIPRRVAHFQWVRYGSVVSKTVNMQSCQDYLTHCLTNNLNLESMVFKGTLYELYCKYVLETVFYGSNLIRNGGAYDNGVDIFGKWQLDRFDKQDIPSKLPATALMKNPKVDLTRDINIFVQCKNHDKKMTAKVIRELSGIYDFHIKQGRVSLMTNFMFLMSPHILSKQAITQLDKAKFPLLHFQLEPLELIDHQHSTLSDFKYGQLNPIYLNPMARKVLSGFNIELQLELLRRNYNKSIKN